VQVPFPVFPPPTLLANEVIAQAALAISGQSKPHKINKSAEPTDGRYSQLTRQLISLQTMLNKKA